MIRKPAVAGLFYEGSTESLRKQLEWCFLHELGPGKIPEVNTKGPRRIVGIVAPHAGYMYSGPVAANAYYALALDGAPEVFVIMGPNHQGVGSPIATCESEVWETPLGNVRVDLDLAREIVRESGIVDMDDEAHAFEHSIEVQLPFLQFVFENTSFKIVPISMLLQDLESSKILGKALAKVLRNRNAVIIASTDFTHYEPHDVAKEKDMKAIECILRIDPELLFKTVRAHNISMCGVGPVATMLVASKLLGASVAQLLKYATSGDITGDKSQVVGYGSLAILK